MRAMSDVVVSISDPSPTHAPRCAACGYDLRGLEKHRCPECGLAFDPRFLPPADVPWLKRNLGGGSNAFLAYYATVFLVLARPRKFGEMVWSEVDVNPAETTRFRAITIGIAVGSALATLLPLVGRSIPALLGLLLAFGLPALAFFSAGTGRFDIIQFRAERYDDETRFRRLHDVSCAGLALTPIVPAALLGGTILDLKDGLLWGLPAAVGIVGLAWWYGTLQFQAHGGRCGVGDILLHALLLPVAWGMLVGAIVIVTLAAIGFATSVLH
jgi:hypothetical protein